MALSFLNLVLQHSWLVLMIVGAILLIATEAGYRAGLRHPPEKRKNRQGQSSSLQNALLGLLGLLLGFSFAMSVERFDARKHLVLDEANGIGTAWLRAAFLPEAQRDKVRAALDDYVDVRLKGATVPVGSPEYRQQLVRSGEIQAELWRAVVTEMQASNTPASSLFAASVNDLLDLDGKRQAATRNHVPQAVWLLLVLVSCTVCWATGYTTALSEAGRHALALVVLPVLLSFVIAVIADLDDPHEGLIQVSQQSMLDLQRSLRNQR